MSITLTDEQVARVLFLAQQIADIRREIPTPPQGSDRTIVNQEIARYLRGSLEAKNEVLVELGALLR